MTLGTRGDRAAYEEAAGTTVYGEDGVKEMRGPTARQGLGMRSSMGNPLIALGAIKQDGQDMLGSATGIFLEICEKPGMRECGLDTTWMELSHQGGQIAFTGPHPNPGNDGHEADGSEVRLSQGTGLGAHNNVDVPEGRRPGALAFYLVEEVSERS